MASYLGTNAYINFNSQTLSVVYRKAKSDEAIGLVDKSAGADTHASYLAALRETTFSVDFLVDGVTVWNALTPGQSATLEWGPEGNGAASGKPKYTATALVKKRTRDEGYTDVVQATVEFQLQAAWTAAAY
jgi:hypothetical protein